MDYDVTGVYGKHENSDDLNVYSTTSQKRAQQNVISRSPFLHYSDDTIRSPSHHIPATD